MKIYLLLFLLLIYACKSQKKPTSSPIVVENNKNHSALPTVEPNTEILSPEIEIPIVEVQPTLVEELEVKPDLYLGTLDDIFLNARQNKKPVLIDFWAKWCGPCKKMEKETFSDPELQEFLNSKYNFYRLDIDSFEGLELAGLHNINAFPTLLVIEPNGKLKKKIQGFLLPKYLKVELEKPY